MVPSGVAIDQTLIVIGRDAVIEGTVHGDVIVVGGDLYMHPGGQIDGRAIAIGGGVYQSMLATISGGAFTFRDFTYDVAQTSGGVSLTYRSLAAERAPPIELEGLFGVHVPTYDRTNGVSIGIGPVIRVPQSDIHIAPSLTYRSQLGVLDPSLAASASVAGGIVARASLGRGTFTNDRWIAGDLINSAEYLFVGDDARNYFRGTRAEATIERAWKSPTITITPYAGGRWESDRSVRPDSFATGGPWTLLGRHDPDDVLRPNPSIDAGDIGSAIAGAELRWTDAGVVANARIDEEVGRFSAAVPDDFSNSTFAQTTFDGTIRFPTFGTQSVRIEGHGVYSSSGSTPRQRWAYVGGVGTIPTLELLSRGGDELIYIDGRYIVPLAAVKLPFGASPVIMLREVLAGAAVGRSPSLDQATGVRVALSVLFAEVLVDPAARRAHFDYGISMKR
jgi:hypothetical protein